MEAIGRKKGGVDKLNLFCDQHGEQTRMQMRQYMNNGVSYSLPMQTRNVIKWLFVTDRYFALILNGNLRFVLSFISKKRVQETNSVHLWTKVIL